jgi:GntR family transcriptional repressor for pyruvate dehydrogenase complex
MGKNLGKFDGKNIVLKVVNPLITKIIDMVKKGELLPGEKLPSQEELSQKLGVSRTSLREALKELNIRGFIYTIHGKGTYVSENTANELEIVEVRKHIENEICFFASKRITDQEISILENIVNSMDKYAKKNDYMRFTDKDCLFHLSIAKFSKNIVFQKIMQTIEDIMLRQQNTVQKVPGAMVRANDYHKKILNAIKKHDSVQASKLMLEHLEDVENTLYQAYYKR